MLTAPKSPFSGLVFHTFFPVKPEKRLLHLGDKHAEVAGWSGVVRADDLAWPLGLGGHEIGEIKHGEIKHEDYSWLESIKKACR